MKHLALKIVSQGDRVALPEKTHQLTLASPALSILTDFRYERPYIVDADLSVSEAQNLMFKAHISFALVTNKREEFVGLITAEKLSGSELVCLVADGHRREDIRVEDLMILRKNIRALEYSQVKASCVKDIVDTLKTSGLDQCLVVDSGEHKIVGLFSARELSRRMHLPIVVSSRPTFADMISIATH